MASPPIDRRAHPADARIARWTAPDGWKLRTFTWPGAHGGARGSILFQGGRGDIFEKYLETLAHWRGQGWNIASFDWRGQGGSGRLVPQANCGHVDRYEDYIDDFRAYFAEWAAAHPGPRIVMGHSMGGHLVLRALVEGAIRPDAAVLIAPMLGFRSPFGPLSERLARLLAGLGDPRRPAWKGNEKPYTTETRAHLLTHDQARYEDEIWWQTGCPELLTGPPSWHWVTEGFRSMRTLAANPRLRSLAVPVLMLVAERDGLVDPRAALRIADRLRDVRTVTFGRESAHEILRETDAVRDRALGEIDLFLAARAPRQ